MDKNNKSKGRYLLRQLSRHYKIRKIDIGEDASAGQAAGVDIAFGYLFPPVGVFVGTFGRSETVPGIVHYLTATM